MTYHPTQRSETAEPSNIPDELRNLGVVRATKHVLGWNVKYVFEFDDGESFAYTLPWSQGNELAKSAREQFLAIVAAVQKHRALPFDEV